MQPTLLLQPVLLTSYMTKGTIEDCGNTEPGEKAMIN